MSIRFACQTYSWQMSIDRYSGRVEHMVGRAAAAGFAGFEPEVVMLGPSYLDASRLRDVLGAPASNSPHSAWSRTGGAGRRPTTNGRTPTGSSR